MQLQPQIKMQLQIRTPLHLGRMQIMPLKMNPLLQELERMQKKKKMKLKMKHHQLNQHQIHQQLNKT